MSFSKGRFAACAAIGAALTISAAGFAQVNSNDVPQVVCKTAFAVASIKNEQGEALSPAEAEWAGAFTSEQQMLECDTPPLSLQLRAHAMLYDDGQGEALRMAETVASYLKQTNKPETFLTWVQPLMNGEHGSVAGRTAVYWLEYAASIGDPQALYELAGVYELGAFHIEKDPAKALAMEVQAAEAGSAIAMFAQGVRYLNGAGVRQSTKTGLEWMKRSAEHGYVDAVWFLAHAHDGSPQGKQYGIAPNRKKAQRYARIAAEAGKPDAMMVYASMLLRDPKSLRHEEEVFYWIDRAVETGDAKAMELAAQVMPDLRRLYRESREQRDAAKAARRAKIMEGLLKQCPRVQRCVVFQNQWGGEVGKNCGYYPDYANCS